MPNWKKVIVSGSDASLNSINVDGLISGSIISGSTIDIAGGSKLRGSVFIPDFIHHIGNAGSRFGFSDDDEFKLATGTHDRLTIENG